MNDYRFERRYNTAIYQVAFAFSVAGFAASFAASFFKPVALVFAAGSAAVGWVIYRGIVSDCVSGIVVTSTEIIRYQTDLQPESNAVALDEIERLDRLHLDDDVVTLTLRDGSTRQIADRFFGRGEELLMAVHGRAPSIMIFDNSKAWRGHASDAME